MTGLSLQRFVHELRRRRTFRTGGLYIVGAWLVMQAGDVFFPAWGLPDAALNGLLISAVLGFPLALVFGWFYDITADGVVRTPPADAGAEPAALQLKRRDYLLLAALGVIGASIVYGGVQNIRGASRVADAVEAFDPDQPAALEHSIAVLPFANTSAAPDDEAFCDGISEEIIHKLSEYGELHVIARTSSFSFKGSDFRVPRIAALLGVRYLLQGSVRRAGNELRILASLVDETGAQLWSASYDRTLASVFAIQSEIADVVANTIVPKIVPRQVARYQPDIEAYKQYLIGRDLLSRRDRNAYKAFAKAAELDPAFADAHADLAISQLLNDRVDVDRAASALEAALALQPDLPRAIAARGLLAWRQTPPDNAAAERYYREALARDPNMVDAMIWLSIALDDQGKHVEADRVTQRAARIDPLHPSITTGIAQRYAWQGESVLAEQSLLRLLEMPNPPRFTYYLLRQLYANTGELVKHAAVSKQEALTGRHVYFGLARIYALFGRWDDTQYWLQLSQEDFPEHQFAPMYPALVPYWQGRYADAVEVVRANVPAADRLHPLGQMHIGIHKALAGDAAGAIATLEPLLGQQKRIYQDMQEHNGFHALAWAYQQVGRREDAREILTQFERGLADYEARGLVPQSGELYSAARNALLAGDKATALDRLQRAVEAGWRWYPIERHDPRWAPLHGHPRYEALMQRVLADVERQRIELERIEADSDFLQQFHSVRAVRKQKAAR